MGKIVDEESLRRNRNVTPQFIGALMEMVWTQIGRASSCPPGAAREADSLPESVAMDLESFSRHAGRATITTDDVLLLARRNQDLHGIIQDFVDRKRAVKAKGKAVER